jgi:hypothetical protein
MKLQCETDNTIMCMSHPDMLDELGDAMDNTDARLTRETQHVIQVTEKAKSGGTFTSHILCA